MVNEAIAHISKALADMKISSEVESPKRAISPDSTNKVLKASRSESSLTKLPSLQRNIIPQPYLPTNKVKLELERIRKLPSIRKMRGKSPDLAAKKREGKAYLKLFP